MPTLNGDIPHFECLVRKEFLMDFKSGHGEFEHGVAHGVCCMHGRCLCFHVLLENGAHIGRLPIHALVLKEGAPRVPGSEPWRLQLWNCFSYQFSVHEFSWLHGLRCRVHLADGTTPGGAYFCTIDYFGTSAAEAAGDAGWKCHHLIMLDDGRIAAQPNNRICWFEASCVEPFPPDQPPKYVTMQKTWDCEDGRKWRTEDTEKMFYGVELT